MSATCTAVQWRHEKCVGVLCLLLLLGLFGTLLTSSLLAAHVQWAGIAVLAGLMVPTLLAILVLWLRNRALVLKTTIAITQLLPYAALLVTLEVVTMGIFTATSTVHLFLVAHLKWLPPWIGIAAGICHVTCLIVASVIGDEGFLSLWGDTAHLFSLRLKQTTITISLLFPFAQMALLFVAQEVLLVRWQSSLASAERKAEAHSQASDRILSVVSHEMQSPLHIIAGFADSIGKMRGSVGAWGKEIHKNSKVLLVCHTCPSHTPCRSHVGLHHMVVVT